MIRRLLNRWAGQNGSAIHPSEAGALEEEDRLFCAKQKLNQSAPDMDGKIRRLGVKIETSSFSKNGGLKRKGN